MVAPGEILSVTVERPAVGGAMIARQANGAQDAQRSGDGGRIVLVTGAVPGERARVRVDRVAKHVAFATTIAVDDESPDRRPAFADPACGGCVYSHIAYPRQLDIKRQVIVDALTRIGRLPSVPAFAIAGSREDGYRMRARLHVRDRRIGFFREGTHELCDPRSTRQLLPATCEALERLMAAAASLGNVVREVELSENIDASERTIHLATTERIDPRVLASITSVEGMTPPPFVTDTLRLEGAQIPLRRHVQAFFQGNRHLLRRLVAHVASLVPDSAGVLDLYAGVGLFSVAAAVVRQARVIAVEGDRFAAEDLRANASAASGRLEPVRGDVEAFVREYRGRRPAGQPAADVVIVDPPRTGMSREALAGAIELQAPRVIYVSCDIATLARDARRLLDGGYTIERLDAFDMFPNTPHVETVAVFSPGSRSREILRTTP
jgi:23S rRNA (uracil1939-C5)-methyltransferase